MPLQRLGDDEERLKACQSDQTLILQPDLG
jgi:hypothetical protein